MKIQGQYKDAAVPFTGNYIQLQVVMELERAVRHEMTSIPEQTITASYLT